MCMCDIRKADTMQGALGICLLIVCCSYFCTGLSPSLIVQTTYGKVKGVWNENGKARVFKGIPYAGSVSGDRRWTDPKFPAKWDGNGDEPLDATKNPPSCPQSCDHEKSPHVCPDPKRNPQKEDCLILNVYTPENANKNSKLPVFVYIHGGAYILGHSDFPLYDGSYLASHSNIIVVTMNYRLGALGFLVFHDKHHDIRGNFAIKDQRLALQWVQNEIPNFGGDSGKVTIAGESAGAMSVAVHMTSKKSAGLFHKAIVESNAFGLEYKTLNRERKHGAHFALWNFGIHGCITLECLRRKTVSQVLKAQMHGLPDLRPGTNVWDEFLFWTPNIDHNGDELTDQPLDLFVQGKYNKVPTMMGTMTDEGLVFIYGAFKSVPQSLYPSILSLLFGRQNKQAALKLYPKGGMFEDHRPQLSKAFGDYVFTCSTMFCAKHTANDVPVYSYVFNHHLKKGLHTNDLCYEPNCHGRELPFVFHTFEEVYNPEDLKFADIVSAYWGNFVKSGDPNTPSGIEDPKKNLPTWPLFKSGTNGVSLIMKPDKIKTKDGYRLDFCEVVDTFGYATRDVFAALTEAADFVNIATATTSNIDIKDEL